MQQRLLQYREAVQRGYAEQQLVGVGLSRTLLHPSTVLADVERHATPVPAAVLDKFSKYQASLVDERKYQRLRAMA